MTFRAIVFVFAIAFTNISLADDLYETGKKAYESADYITAIKNLFAYKQINIDKLKKNPEFEKLLDDKIENSEKQLCRCGSSRKKRRFDAEHPSGSFDGE